MSPEEDGEHLVYRCPNCNATLPSWGVPQLATRLAATEEDYRYGDPVPRLDPNERR